MTVETRAQRAKDLFLRGYNCAQAVAVAFADLLGMEERTVARLTSGFGGGIGRMREVCGSISGMVFVINALYGYDDPQAREEKAALYAEIQTLAEAFRKENGSIICRELLGLSPMAAPSPVPEARSADFYRKRPCAELVEMSASLLEDYIQKRNG